VVSEKAGIDLLSPENPLTAEAIKPTLKFNFLIFSEG
jgi:hypothetical protein